MSPIPTAERSAPAMRAAAGGARGRLAVRLCNWVGEVVLALPTLQRLADAGYQLELIGKRWAVALLQGSGWPVHVRPSATLAAIAQLRELLRAGAPASAAPALLLTKSFSSALEARLGGWCAVGYARDGRSFLLTRAVPLPRFAHASHAYWHLVSAFLGSAAPYPTESRLAPSAAQRAQAHELLQAHGLTAREFVALCPFSGADDRDGRKVWPGFNELGRRLAERGTAAVVCPGPGEEARAGAVLPRAKLLPGLDLGVYAAVLACARAVVANDTGPGHLAAAVGAPLIAVYGPRSIAAWAPLGDCVTLLHDTVGWAPVERVWSALPL